MKRLVQYLFTFWLRFRASSYWKDVAWLATGTSVAQVASVLAMPALSRIYSPEDFAIQNLFLRITGFATIIATFRYEYFIQLPKKHEEAWKLVCLVVGLGCGATLLFSPWAWVYQETFARWAGAASLAPWLVFIPATAAAISISTAFQGYVQRLRNYRSSSEANVLDRLVALMTMGCGHLMLPGAGGLVLGRLTGCLANLSWLRRKADQPVESKETRYRVMASTYLPKGGAMMLSHCFLAISITAPSLYIAHSYGDNALGQFALAFQLVSLPTSFLGLAISNVYYQRAAESWANGKSFYLLWRSTAIKLTAVGLPVFLLLGFLSLWFFPLVFGNQWELAGKVAAVLCVGSFFAFTTSALSRTCMVLGKYRYLYLWHGVRALSTIAVVILASHYEYRFGTFLLTLMGQTSLLYIADFFAELYFVVKSKPEDSVIA